MAELKPMSPARIRRLMQAPTVEPDHRIAEAALLRFARLRGEETGRALGAILLRRQGRGQ